MSTIREGSQVSYVGYGVGGLAVGDQGKVLANSGTDAHVRWTTGAAQGQIILVAHEDLVAARRAVEVDTDLGSGPLVSLAVREIYDEQGEEGLTAALNEAGHLAGFTQIAEEALGYVQAKISADPSVIEVLGHLDSAEQTDMLNYLAATLLRDAFGRDD